MKPFVDDPKQCHYCGSHTSCGCESHYKLLKAVEAVLKLDSPERMRALRIIFEEQREMFS